MNPLIADPAAVRAEPRVIVALDFAAEADTLAFVRRLRPDACRVKVGKELFTATGRRLVEQLVNQGFDVFLDLKYHDIPNTVAAACRTAAQMGVWLADVHAGGGRRMLEAAAEAVANLSQRPKLIAVTVLTSLEAADLREIGFAETPEQLVPRWAALARDCGLDGVVCSAHEAADLRARLGADCLLVTPGIRPEAAADDQRRVMTPAQALTAGADYLVVGRPITRAADPAAVLDDINRQAQAVLQAA